MTTHVGRPSYPGSTPWPGPGPRDNGLTTPERARAVPVVVGLAELLMRVTSVGVGLCAVLGLLASLAVVRAGVLGGVVAAPMLTLTLVCAALAVLASTTATALRDGQRWARVAATR